MRNVGDDAAVAADDDDDDVMFLIKCVNIQQLILYMYDYIVLGMDQKHLVNYMMLQLHSIHILVELLNNS